MTNAIETTERNYEELTRVEQLELRMRRIDVSIYRMQLALNMARIEAQWSDKALLIEGLEQRLKEQNDRYNACFSEWVDKKQKELS